MLSSSHISTGLCHLHWREGSRGKKNNNIGGGGGGKEGGRKGEEGKGGEGERR